MEVFGLRFGSDSKAYALGAFEHMTALNDTIDQFRLVLVTDATGGSN